MARLARMARKKKPEFLTPRSDFPDLYVALSQVNHPRSSGARGGGSRHAPPVPRPGRGAGPAAAEVVCSRPGSVRGAGGVLVPPRRKTVCSRAGRRAGGRFVQLGAREEKKHWGRTGRFVQLTSPAPGQNGSSVHSPLVRVSAPADSCSAPHPPAGGRNVQLTSPRACQSGSCVHSTPWTLPRRSDAPGRGRQTSTSDRARSSPWPSPANRSGPASP